MKRPKFYFKDDAENCYTIKQHIDMMKFDGETEREVFRAKAERGTDEHRTATIPDLTAIQS